MRTKKAEFAFLNPLQYGHTNSVTTVGFEFSLKFFILPPLHHHHFHQHHHCFQTDEHTQALSLPSCWVFTIAAGTCESELWGPIDLSSRSHSSRTEGHVHKLIALVPNLQHDQPTHKPTHRPTHTPIHKPTHRPTHTPIHKPTHRLDINIA